MDTYLITGGTGFIGANLTRRLVNMGKEDIHLLLKKESNLWRIKDIVNKIKIHKVDLYDGKAVEELVNTIKPDIIFHLGVYGAYAFQQDIDRILRTNILGTANLLNACVKCGFRIFVNTGTSSEYGFASKSTKETDLLEPNSYYAVSKASATLYCSYVARAYKLPIVIFRLYSAYGPYEEPARFIPSLINYALAGGLPKLVSPEIARDFIYIDDVVDAYLAVLDSTNLGSGEIYNLGTGKQTTIREAVDSVKKILNVNVDPRWNAMEGRIWDTNVWVADIEKIKKRLGWKPRYTFLNGLRETINWFKTKKDPYKEIYKYNIRL